ncbi:MAG: hypothetical protein ABR991_07025 [Terracidiphilus sp.]|jgi:hypothetical protein
MNRDKKIPAKITDSEMDTILAGEEPLIPSSGFLVSVMNSVQQEAAAPDPLPFPWIRVLPGVLAITGIIGWSGFELIHLGPQTLGLTAQNSFTLAPSQIPAALLAPVESVGWVALALGISLLSWLLARRLAGRGGLL